MRGVLALRHGLEHHRAQVVQPLYEAAQRFSVELYIQLFVSRWPEERLPLLHIRSDTANDHLRRFFSEGARPRVP